MERERIKVSGFEIGPLINEYYFDNCSEEIYNEYFDLNGNQIKNHFSDDFAIISDKIYVDLEKGYTTNLSVFKRISDNKYFEAKYNYSPYTGFDYPGFITEVFPKQGTITVYE